MCPSRRLLLVPPVAARHRTPRDKSPVTGLLHPLGCIVLHQLVKVWQDERPGRVVLQDITFGAQARDREAVGVGGEDAVGVKGEEDGGARANAPAEAALLLGLGFVEGQQGVTEFLGRGQSA